MANVVLWPWVKVIAVVAAIMFGTSKFFDWAQKRYKII